MTPPTSSACMVGRRTSSWGTGARGGGSWRSGARSVWQSPSQPGDEREVDRGGDQAEVERGEKRARVKGGDGWNACYVDPTDEVIECEMEVER